MEQKKNFLELETKIVDAIKTVYDPEIPVNIYDLGLIYEIKIDDNNEARITMTLTSPNCPEAETLPIQARDVVRAVEGIRDAHVEIVFDPPWSRDNISEAAMLELGLL